MRRVIVTAAAMAALCGCLQGHNTLGTGSGPCFRAIPVAVRMVHHRGTFIGVRRGGRARVGSGGAVRPARGTGVCLVAYRGHFRPADVYNPVGRTEGDYAVAVVSLRDNRPLRTIVTSRPVRFRHL